LINYKRNGQDAKERGSVATEWKPSPLDLKTTLTTTGGTYCLSNNEKEPFARIGKVDTSRLELTDLKDMNFSGITTGKIFNEDA